MTTDRRTASVRVGALLHHSLHPIRTNLHLWRWLVPLLLALMVIGYELLISRWLYQHAGYQTHLLVDTLLFGTVGPLLVFIVLYFVDRWQQERQTSDLQAQMMTNLRDDVTRCRDLNDEAVQVLFSTHALIEAIKPDLPPASLQAIERTEAAIDHHIRRLRHHLLESDK